MKVEHESLSGDGSFFDSVSLVINTGIEPQATKPAPGLVSLQRGKI